MPRLLTRNRVAAALLVLGTTSESRAMSDAVRAREIEEFLRRFDANPREVMDEAPPRWDESGRPLPPGDPAELRFPQRAIRSGEALAARDRLRTGMCMNYRGTTRCLGPALGARAEIGGSDLPEALVDNGTSLVRSLEDMDARKLRKSTLPTQPWSGDYWGYFKGVIAARYEDAAFPGSNPDAQGGYSWRRNKRYFLDNPPEWIARNGTQAEIDRLSPAEKYDLLVGDRSFSLTRSMWDSGERYMDPNGVVPTWMGICNGWANAAFMVSRPALGVALPFAEGEKTLRFYPDDIKALASLLWADGKFPVRFIGGRCRTENPERDENGRVISRSCFDTNPGTFHLSLVNQLGISRRSLVMDATYDYEVWNHPVLRYRYSYFNPKTREDAETLAEARVPISRFTNDRFRRYRSPDASSVVGIALDVSYMIETPPTHARTDSQDQDWFRTVRYVYDLELDSGGNIIGGEWYTHRHPDFLFVPEPGTRAVTDHENRATGSWNGGEPMPESWRRAGKAAGRDGLPLTKIVEVLIQRSQSEPQSPRRP